MSCPHRSTTFFTAVGRSFSSTGGYVPQAPTTEQFLFGSDDRPQGVLLKFRMTFTPAACAAAKTASSRATLTAFQLGGLPGETGSVSRLGHGSVNRVTCP